MSPRRALRLPLPSPMIIAFLNHRPLSRWLTAGLVALVLPLLTPAARAHDVGFGHFRLALYVTATATDYTLEYRVRVHADTAMLEMVQQDTDHDGIISPIEKQTFYQKRGQELADGLVLTTAGGGAPLAATLVDWSLGQALTQTFRLRVTTTAPELLLDDHNFPAMHGSIHAYSDTSVRIELPADSQHTSHVTLHLHRLPAATAVRTNP